MLTGETHRPGRGRILAVSQHCFFRAEADDSNLRLLVFSFVWIRIVFHRKPCLHDTHNALTSRETSWCHNLRKPKLQSVRSKPVAGEPEQTKPPGQFSWIEYGQPNRAGRLRVQRRYRIRNLHVQECSCPESWRE